MTDDVFYRYDEDNPYREPMSPVLALRYLTSHGNKAMWSVKAGWMIERYFSKQDWSVVGWSKHRRTNNLSGTGRDKVEMIDRDRMRYTVADFVETSGLDAEVAA